MESDDDSAGSEDSEGSRGDDHSCESRFGGGETVDSSPRPVVLARLPDDDIIEALPPAMSIAEKKAAEKVAHYLQTKADKARLREEELQQLRNRPFSYVRKAVREQVHDSLWLNELKRMYEEVEKSARLGINIKKYRCSVCTLPFGACKHSEEWVKTRHFERMVSRSYLNNIDVDGQKKVKKTKTENDIDDVMNMIELSELKIKTKTVPDDIDIHGTRWSELMPRRSDKIGDNYMALSLPSERGWHTAVDMDGARLTLVFGGFRYKGSQTPQPFGPSARPDDVEYLSDIVAFDRLNSSWHKTKSGFVKDAGRGPQGRYGHVAASLDGNRMFVFGGRGASGRILGDSWIYDCAEDFWTPLPSDAANVSPGPRVFAAAASLRGTVYLFGGTDGSDAFGDVWIFHGSDPADMYWERGVAVGQPPSPRYGHRMVVTGDGEVAVLGGCSVGPSSEVAGNAMTMAETKKLLDMSNSLQRQYYLEGATASLGGHLLQSNVSSGGSSLKEMYRESSSLAGRVHNLEEATRGAEQTLVDHFNLAQASRFLKQQKARHPVANLDIVFLNVHEMSWRSQVYPPIKGEPPKARIHFDAFAIGRYVFVLGGAQPTSLTNALVDDGHSRLFALDLDAHRWVQPHPVLSTEYFEKPLEIARADIIRAQQRAEAEKHRGHALGARNGMTVERAEADAVLEVCKWRLKTLEKDCASTCEPPSARWGATFTRIGQRALYLGGWKRESIVAKEDMFVLNMEHDMERARREDDDYRARLERDRQKQEWNASMNDMESAFELKAMKLAELEREAKERRRMAIEEILSFVPPLSKPLPVKLVKANEATMWVKWDKVYKNADGQTLKPGSITYMLYMRNGYRSLAVEDRVIVMSLFKDVKVTANDNSSVGGSASSVQSALSSNVRNQKKGREDSLFDERRKEEDSDDDFEGHEDPASPTKPEPDDEPHVCDVFRGRGGAGEIVGMAGHGLFDVAFDDGAFEKAVPRWRIALENPLEAFTGLHLDHNGMAIKPSDTVLNSMVYAMRGRILRKSHKKKNLAKALLRLNPKFPKVKEELIARKKTEDEQRVLSKKRGDNDDKNDCIDSDVESDDEIKYTEEEIMAMNLNSIRKGGPPIINVPKEPTIRPGPEWELIYLGLDTEYECHGIIPREVRLYEPDLPVRVAFRLQTLGADFPSYEYSNLSDESFFLTQKSDINSPLVDDLSSVATTLSSSGSSITVDIKKVAQERKTKKQIITAIIGGKSVVTIEKQNDSCMSEGLADHYE